MAPSSKPIPTPPDADEPEPVGPERVVRERLADPGPLRPWGEFEAEEQRRKPQPAPAPR